MLRKGRYVWERRVDVGRPLRKPLLQGSDDGDLDQRKWRRWRETGGICVRFESRADQIVVVPHGTT